MPSLTQLLTEHRHLLILDAASTSVQVGLLRAGAADLWRTTTDEAGRGIFVGCNSLLREAGLRLQDVDAFVFCEGPGSMLGIRTVAMAIRTWQILRQRPAFAYQSLAVAGVFERIQNGKRDFTVIADARRETWHVQRLGADGRMSPLQRVPTADLPVGQLMMPEKFRTWAKPARQIDGCTYDLGKIFPTLQNEDLFRAVNAPDAFQHEAPEYKKWAARIHSVATVNQR